MKRWISKAQLTAIEKNCNWADGQVWREKPDFGEYIEITLPDPEPPRPPEPEFGERPVRQDGLLYKFDYQKGVGWRLEQAPGMVGFFGYKLATGEIVNAPVVYRSKRSGNLTAAMPKDCEDDYTVERIVAVVFRLPAKDKTEPVCECGCTARNHFTGDGYCGVHEECRKFRPVRNGD